MGIEENERDAMSIWSPHCAKGSSLDGFPEFGRAGRAAQHCQKNDPKVQKGDRKPKTSPNHRPTQSPNPSPNPFGSDGIFKHKSEMVLGGRRPIQRLQSSGALRWGECGPSSQLHFHIISIDCNGVEDRFQILLAKVSFVFVHLLAGSCFWMVCGQFLVGFWLVPGWFLVGFGLVSGWFLISFWLVSGWFPVGFWLVP